MTTYVPQTSAAAVCYSASRSMADVQMLLSLRSTTSYELFALHARNWRTTLRRIVARVQNGEFGCVVNLCSNGNTDNSNSNSSGGGGNDDEGGYDDDVTAAMVALVLDRCGVPYTGCRADLLSYPLDVLYMAMWYAPVPLPRFVVISNASDDDEVAAAVARLQPPLLLRSATSTTLGGATQLRVACEHDDENDASSSIASQLRAALRQHGKLVVCEDATQTARVQVYVEAVGRAYYDPYNCDNSSGSNNNTQTMQTEKRLHLTDLRVQGRRQCTEAATKALMQHATAFAKQVMCERGVALLTFAPARSTVSHPHANDSNGYDSAEWCLYAVELNNDPIALAERMHEHNDDVDAPAMTVSNMLDNLVRDACVDVQRRCFDVRAKYEAVDNDGSSSSKQSDSVLVVADNNRDKDGHMTDNKSRLREHTQQGYCVCARRNIAAGEVVFEDEGTTFTLTTMPHVRQHWGHDAQHTFSEYAWPLDRDGHLYAIWDRNFAKWRPINHSCDPNCHFAAPHSLNVQARRDIAAGEELTMDYVTFCDAAMKSFTCRCNSPSCRGVIAPDEAMLRRYGQHAWLRTADTPDAASQQP